MTTRSGIAAVCPISVTRARVPASSADASASISRKPSACEKLVTEPEPLAVGNATGPSLARDQRDQHELLAAELGGDAHRHVGLDGARGFRRQTGARADHRRHEGMEGEDRRGRKSRQHRQRLAVDHRQAKRLAGLERDAMDENAGLAELRHDAVREIARALRGAAGEHHHVAGFERACASQARARPRRPGKRRTAPARRRLPPPPPQRSRRCCRRPAPDRARRPAPPARRRSRAPPLWAGAPTSTSAMPQAASMPISREPMRGPAPQHHLAARDVGAGIGDELAGRGGAAQVDRRCALVLDQLGMLDHHHRVGAARNHAAGRDRGGRAGRDLERRRMAAHDHLAVETQPARRDVARARGVGGAQREAVHIGAIERRHVDRRGHVMREHAAERVAASATVSPASGARSRCRAKRARASSAETTSRNCSCRAARRIAAIEIVLGRFRFEACRHGQGLITTSAPAGYPSLSARHQNPSVGLRQRRERHIARGYGFQPRRRACAPERPRRAPRSRRYLARRAWRLAAAAARVLPASRASIASPEHVPNRQRRIEPAGQCQHRPRADRTRRPRSRPATARCRAPATSPTDASVCTLASFRPLPVPPTTMTASTASSAHASASPSGSAVTATPPIKPIPSATQANAASITGSPLDRARTSRNRGSRTRTDAHTRRGQHRDLQA